MAQLVTVRLNKSEQQPLGFRLQGGKDFGTPLVVQKVNGGSAAERAGLQAGDALIRVNTTDVFTLRHQEAQDAIRAAGGALELTIQRGGNTWRPSVTPTGSLPRPGRSLGATPTPVTQTSLKANSQPSRAFGSGHNNVAKPFSYMNGSGAGGDTVKGIVNKQYNSPVAMYSDKTIAETLSAQTEVLAGGVLGVNFKKNEKTYDAEKSEVFKMLQEAQNDPEPELAPSSGGVPPMSGLRHVPAPTPRPDAPVNNTGGLPPGQNICEDCERLITGVFVRIKDKNLHVECFKCATCGSSLKNQGYYNLNGKLYCDIHAKLVARQQPPGPNLEPVTVPPGGRLPTNSYSTPLPPLTTNNNYTNGSSSMFSPSSNFSGPKPFGSSLGSAYSPASLSPRSAPLSPARPVTAPAPVPTPVAPFAPKAPVSVFKAKNVKSVVWPPPNPPEDEPPVNVHETIVKHSNTSNTKTDNLQLAECTRSIATNSDAINNQKVVEKVSSSHCQEMTEVSSMSTFSSTAMSASAVSSTAMSASAVSSTAMSASAVSSSTMSETIAQSQEVHHSITSVTSEQTSNTDGLAMYQSQTSPPIQNTFQNPMEIQVKDERSNKIDVNHVSNVESEQVVIKAEERRLSEQNISLITCEEVKTIQQQDNSNVISEQNMFVNTNEINETHAEQKLSEQRMECKSIENERLIQTENPEIEAKIEHECDISENKSNVASTTKNEIRQPMKLINEIPSIKPLPPSNIQNSIPRGFVASMIDALTTAPDRPYSPLPIPVAPILPMQNVVKEEMPATSAAPENMLENIPEPTPMFTQQPKRCITPIPPVKPYNPPEKREEPMPMPAQTQPYIPPDFKITIEPKEPKQSREKCSSPMVEALTTAPDRPFSPIPPVPNIERGSLREAVTIAPDRSYSPLPLGIINQSSQFSSFAETSASYVQSTSSDIARPIATQTSTLMSERRHSEMSTIQNACKLQTSSEVSAFRPVVKQTFPPPQPEEMCKLSGFTPLTSQFQSNNYQQKTMTESMTTSVTSTNVDTKSFSSVKASQSFFEQLDQRETMSSVAVRSTSGLQKPDNIPSYQKHFDKLPSQRGITPEVCNAPAILQRPVTPTTDPPIRPRDKSQDRSQFIQAAITPPQVKQPQPKSYVPQQKPVIFHTDAPISMTFQPVSDDVLMRSSPARSRPTTPSLINKPAPIIPHYQMNLVAVEHTAPDTHLHEPSSPETSRSPTPKLRSRSPAQGPPPNPLKAQAPRIKESTPQRQNAHSLLTQATSNLRKEHEMNQKSFQSNIEIFNASGAKNWGNQPSIIKEQRQSNVGFQSECYDKGDLHIKEDSMLRQNAGQRQMQAHNVTEYGNTIVQSSRKTFKEFESRQSAKVIEIHKGGSKSSNACQIDSNIAPSANKPKLVFPPPVMALPINQSCSINQTKDVTATSSVLKQCQPSPSISGANQSPVCDPPPSTGSSVGAAARGKAFGVSSAPKRGRGVLNKAALPGSRVPLCGSCNGNISSLNGNATNSQDTNGNNQDNTFDSVVRRRQKKNDNTNDGRRDSHIIARGLSTMKSEDVADGLYPVCHKCDKAITRGPFITALGRIWCPEHFTCVNATCRRHLQDIGFVEENGQLYCEFCFEQYIAPACDKCHAKIKGDCLNAIGKHFHPECFNCVYCSKLFGNNPFFLEDGLPYCEADWNELFTTKCFACGFPVEAGDRWVEALSNNYHSQCFNCTVCKKNLEGQSFFAKGGRPFCKTHAR